MLRRLNTLGRSPTGSLQTGDRPKGFPLNQVRREGITVLNDPEKCEVE